MFNYRKHGHITVNCPGINALFCREHSENEDFGMDWWKARKYRTSCLTPDAPRLWYKDPSARAQISRGRCCDNKVSTRSHNTLPSCQVGLGG